MTALLALMLCCAVLFLLPLLPAILEWRRPTDAQPFTVKDDRQDKLDYYRVRYRLLIETRLRPFMEQAQASASQIETTVPERHIRLMALPGGQNAPRLSPKETAARETSRMILATGDLALPGDIVFSYAAYTDGSLTGGPGLVVRAVMAKGDIRLGERTRLLRWAHTDGALVAGKGSRLFGRVTAGRALTLERGCEFHRIHAPRIETRADDADALSESGNPAPGVLHHRPQDSAARTRVMGSLTIEDEATHQGNLVTAEDLSLGFRAGVMGSVKGNRNVTLGTGSRVHGSVVAGHRLVMQQDSLALGPIVADEAIEIGPGCVIGAPDNPTTVTAPDIRIAAGALVYGSVWAVKKGVVS